MMEDTEAKVQDSNKQIWDKMSIKINNDMNELQTNEKIRFH